MLGALVGCMSERKVNHYISDNKTYRDSLTANILSQHPCDTVRIYKSDTTYQHDTTTISKIDTIGNYIHDTTFRRITTILRVHDTAVVIDNRLLDAANLKLQIANTNIATLNGVITTQQLQISKEHSRGNEAWLYFGLLLAAIVIALVLYIIKPRL
jgi:hypothetical protein